MQHVAGGKPARHADRARAAGRFAPAMLAAYHADTGDQLRLQVRARQSPQYASSAASTALFSHLHDAGAAGTAFQRDELPLAIAGRCYDAMMFTHHF